MPYSWVGQVLDQAVDLDMVGDVVRRVQVDLVVARERLVIVALVAVEDLVAGGN